MKTYAEYDCANPTCDRYHVLVERTQSKPTCAVCGKRLRMVRPIKKMSEEAKQRLRELAEQRRLEREEHELPAGSRCTAACGWCGRCT